MRNLPGVGLRSTRKKRAPRGPQLPSRAARPRPEFTSQRDVVGARHTRCLHARRRPRRLLREGARAPPSVRARANDLRYPLHARAPCERPLTASVPPAPFPPRPTPQPARRVRASRAVTAQARKADGAAGKAAKPAPAAGGEKAKLPKEYTYHTPGSVQETDDEVVFAHQTPEEAGKWANCAVSHVGDDSHAAVRVGVVIGEFHNTLMDRMLEDARVAAVSMNATIDEVVWVPGTYEAPLVVEKMLESDLDAVVVVGYIEKGSTLHGQEMGATCSLVFKQLELEYSKPVGMGIVGPGATAEQAESRVAYAGNAMRAAIRMARFLATPEVN